MKLYFGNMVTTVTTLMVLSLVGFVGYSISNRNNINFWGRRSLFVLVYGLVICCFAAARDGLDKTIQYTIDGSCNPGIFSLVSVPNIVGCVGVAIIIIAAIATPIAKSQHMREIWFYVMSGGVMPVSYTHLDVYKRQSNNWLFSLSFIWFKNGVEASLFAPTALNKQDYKIIGTNNRVKIEIDNGIFTGANKGLIKYHFELGAGKENFEWE